MRFGGGVVVMAGGERFGNSMMVLIRCAFMVDAAGQCAAVVNAGRGIGSRLKGSHCCGSRFVLGVSESCGNRC